MWMKREAQYFQVLSALCPRSWLASYSNGVLGAASTWLAYYHYVISRNYRNYRELSD